MIMCVIVANILNDTVISRLGKKLRCTMEFDIVGLCETTGSVQSKLRSMMSQRRFIKRCHEVLPATIIALPLRRNAGKLAYIIFKLSQCYKALTGSGIGVLLYDEVSRRVIEPC